MSSFLGLLPLLLLPLPPQADAAELILGAPRLFNQGRDIRLLVREPDTNLIYEIQSAPDLASPAGWHSVERGLPGQTNFVVRLPSNAPSFFRIRLPPLASPAQLSVPEDVSLFLQSIRLQLGGPEPGTLSLTVSNGWLMTENSGVGATEHALFTATGDHTSTLQLAGTISALQQVLPTLRYQGATNFFGRDDLTVAFDATVRGTPIHDAVHIELAVLAVDDAPIAQPDSFTCTANTTLLVAAPGVLRNDVDPEGDALSAVLTVGPDYGTLALDPDGSFVYLPDPQFEGPDRFLYRAIDSHGESEETMVSLQIVPIREGPIVRLLSPAADSSIPPGSNVVLRAEVTPRAHPIVRVDYFTGPLRIGTVLAPPFDLMWEHPPEGRHLLTAQATDHAGLQGSSVTVTITVESDCDGDGISDRAESSAGTDPCDFFNGQAALVRILSGNFQHGPPAITPSQPLALRVTNLRGTPATNRSVTFKVVEGSAAVAEELAGEWSQEQMVHTDGTGRASVRARTPLSAGEIGIIHASLPNQLPPSPATFVVTAVGPQPGWVWDNETVAVAAGAEHALALQADGTIRAWGRNQAGQLGDGIDPSAVPFSTSPLLVPNLSNVVAIAAGSLHSLALLADGTVRAWGEYLEHFKPTPPPGLRGVIAIAAGEGHSLALLEGGTVQAWGDPYTAFVPPAGLAGVTAIAAGRGFSLALRASGTVAAWGIGPFHPDLGQLQVPAGLNDIQAIAAGGSHSLALRRNGTVAAWGGNQFGQSTPPDDLSQVIAIAAGEAHSLALRSDGSVVLWGHSPLGPTGLIQELQDIRTLTAGVGFSSFLNLALRFDGTVWAWGKNAYGQLGDPSQLPSSRPVRVAGLPAGGAITNPVPFEVYTPLR